jgi:hypothetical protein
VSVKLVNVSNLACFGANWVDDGRVYQLYNLRGTTSLFLASLRDDGSWWNMGRVDDPYRFGMVTAPTRFSQFRKVVESFITTPSA